MRIIELPEGKGYAEIIVDGKSVGSVWMNENAKLSMGKESWILKVGKGDVFIHGDAIRRRDESKI